MAITHDPRLGVAPTPPDPWEAERWQYTALARRIMLGVWGDDLEDWLVAHYGITRRDALGPRDLSSNVLRTVSTQLAALYDDAPTLTHPSGDFPELLAIGDDDTEAGLIAKTGLWSQMQRVQQMVIALGEYLVHVSYTEEDGFLFRAVPPDYILAEARPEAPDRPVVLRELRRRAHPSEAGKSVWTWDEYDIRDRENPTFRILSASKSKGVGIGDDLTSAYLREPQSGASYFWRNAQGKPVIPYVVYHRAKTGELWDAYCGRELTDGTLTVAALWTDFVHAVRDASWLQRYICNAEIAGAAPVSGKDAAPWKSVPADRASILVFNTVAEGQSLIGAFPAPSDPDVIGRAITKFEERLAQYVGVSPGDLSRTSGDPRSGYALAVSEHGKEQAQRRFLPTFRAADEELAALSATILNRATGSTYPESGYRARYAFQAPVVPGKPVPASEPAVKPAEPEPETPAADVQAGE